LKGLFLAERANEGAFLFRFDGQELNRDELEKKIKVKGENSTHVLMVGRKYVDASNTTRYPAGLLNTNPSGPNSCVFASSITEHYQTKAPSRSARNVFLAKSYPAGTMLTVNYGLKKDFNTRGFVKLMLEPTNSDWTAQLQSCFRGRRSGVVPRPFPRPKKKKKSKSKKKTRKEEQEAADAALARQFQYGMRRRR